ncbi:MAG: hypothetical protein H6686_00470 [Fibrobacteria bacterium]|nr:hypothetical protein [Fibrobacteria bacterium]
MISSFRRTPMMPILLVLVAGTLVSCQQDVATKPQDSTGPFVVMQTSSIDSSRMPDSVTWTYRGESGAFAFTATSRQSFEVRAPFPQSIVSDTLVVGLWTLGLRTTLVPSIVLSNGGFTPIQSLRQVDSGAVRLLQSFDSLRHLDHATFGYNTDPVESQVISLQRAVAALLYSRKLRMSMLPEGVDSAAVVIKVLVLAARSGSSLDEVVSITGLDKETLETITASLFQNGDLSPSDSAFLTPAYPVRLLAPLLVETPLVAGGDPVPLLGTFGWAKGRKVSSQFRVMTREGLAPDFQFLVRDPIRSTDTLWTLSGNATLQAPADAIPGTDTLVVVLADDSGHSASARAVFEVLARDTTSTGTFALDSAAPVVTPSETTRDTTVPWSTRRYDLSWTVTDDSALASVTLDGSDLAGDDGLFVASVSLDVGRDSFQLVAKDRRGRETRSLVVIVREADTTAPRVSLISPQHDTSVPNSVDRIEVSATATDLGGIDSVAINGVKSGAEPFKVVVLLAVGANVVEAKAWDEAGNVSEPVSVTITREKSPGDTVPPRIERTSPEAGDTAVGFATKSIVLSYVVTDDSSLASVSVDGTVLTGVQGVYSIVQPLATGLNRIVLEAKDARGNTSRDTVRINRPADPTAPVATWMGGTKDTTLWAFVPSLTATWKVTDNSLKLVTIDGAATVKSGDLHSRKVVLGSDTTWIRLMALDSSGNTVEDSIRVVRKYDRDAPVAILQKAKFRLVANGVGRDTLVWIVREDLKLASVTLNGKEIPGTDSVFSAIVPLTLGTNRFVLQAQDSAGNKTLDTAIVARAAYPPKHSAAPGRYIGTVYDTITAVGADSVLYSTDGASWKRLEGPLALTATGTVYAKSMPGDAIASADYTVSQVVKVASGGDNYLGNAYTLFLMDDGSVWGAGSNKMGNFGFSSTGSDNILTALKVPLTGKVTDISVYTNAGVQRSFFRMSTGTWYGAGLNYTGEIGAGPLVTASPAPLSAVVLKEIEEVAAGNGETYFRRKDGTVWGVGDVLADLGDTDPPLDGTPIRIPGLSSIASIRASFPYSSAELPVPRTMALDSAGTAWGWGYDARVPEKLASGVKAIALSSVAMILLEDGTVMGMGSNNKGQVGNGTSTTTGAVFSPTKGLKDIHSIATGGFHSLFLDGEGTLFLSGLIETEMTGTSQPLGPITLVPVQLDGDVSDIWCGFDASFYKKKDGTLWGLGSAMFGDGKRDTTSVPRRIDF